MQCWAIKVGRMLSGLEEATYAKTKLVSKLPLAGRYVIWEQLGVDRKANGDNPLALVLSPGGFPGEAEFRA